MITINSLSSDPLARILLFSSENNIKRLEELGLVCKLWKQITLSCYKFLPTTELSRKISFIMKTSEHEQNVTQQKLKEVICSNFAPLFQSINTFTLLKQGEESRKALLEETRNIDQVVFKLVSEKKERHNLFKNQMQALSAQSSELQNKESFSTQDLDELKQISFKMEA